MEEALKLILEKLDSLEKGQVKLTEEVAGLKAGQAELTEEVAGLKAGQAELTEDVKEIKFKVDILYNWVDGIDLAVKNLKRSC